MSLGRRQFIRQAATTAVIGGYFVNPAVAGQNRSVSGQVRVAVVGTGNRGDTNIQALMGNAVILAAADVDSSLLGAFSKTHNLAKTYRDFRVMLQREEKNIDAVLISTPDHCHAPAAAMALRMKKHVYCEKPLSHTVVEARTLARLAADNKLVTQLGTQMHAGENYRRVVELVQAGAIGDVAEVHVWCSAKYSGGKFTRGSRAPGHLNWDLWLGPAPQRPYSDGVHPIRWRRFWDYSGGALGDFGCHYLDLVHWALNLRHPTRIRSEGPPVDSVSPPDWTIVHYDYPRRGEMPPVKLTWYDGGKRPAALGALPGDPIHWKNGQLFVGSKGMIVADFDRYLLLPAERFADYPAPTRRIAPSIGHHREWIEAIRGGGVASCDFDYSGALTETILLGTVAYRSGKTLQWHAPTMKITNAADAEHLLHKEYRRGWEL